MGRMERLQIEPFAPSMQFSYHVRARFLLKYFLFHNFLLKKKAGIGVTPFASILQSVWFKYSKSSYVCPSCNFASYDAYKEKKLRKVDFIWVNQDFNAFEWFIDLLAQIERLQSESKLERFIDIHLFMTKAQTKDKIKADAIKSLLATKAKQDSFPSDFLDLIEKIEPGRPDIDKVCWLNRKACSDYYSRFVYRLSSLPKYSRKRKVKLKLYFVEQINLQKTLKEWH
jgi:hypothetical protein